MHLLSLKTNKAFDLDNISARLLKCGARAICPSITKLPNLSIRTGSFPEIWKCSKVAALFKSGHRTNASNYRPISILPTISKILEKVVHSQFYDFLFLNNLISSKHLAFVPSCPQHQLSLILQMRSYCIWRVENCAGQSS